MNLRIETAMPVSSNSIAIEENPTTRHENDLCGPSAARSQAAIGLSFPRSYLEFVSRLGCGGAGSSEFYGVVSDEFEKSTVPDAIWLTLPQELIIVGDVGDGAQYVLYTSQRRMDGECPVIEWWPGADDADQCREPLAPDFGTFFLARTREVIARESEEQAAD